MAKTARFYLSRISKLGAIDTDGIIAAIRNSESIQSRGYDWTIVDVEEDVVQIDDREFFYLSANLAKYDRDAQVEIVDEKMRKTFERHEPNMQRAASKFVYFPSEATFCHRHVWNEIRETDFRKRMKDIIEHHPPGILSEVGLNLISDLSKFLGNMASLDTITKIAATVTPPNPLFGPLWKSLRDYLESRKLRRLSIAENANDDTGLNTKAQAIAQQTIKTTQTSAPNIDSPQRVEIGDAAILMAADGYGNATIHGRRDGQGVVVKTSESAIQLELDSEITASELASVTILELIRLQKNRDWQH